MTQSLRSLAAFMLLIVVVISLPNILKGIGAVIYFLFQCAAALILGYIAIAIVVGLFMMIFNFQNKEEDGAGEKAWKF